MPHEKGFKTSFVVAAHQIDDVRRYQQRIEGLFGVRLHMVETNASHTDRWIEVYNAESQDICTKVTEYVRALCTPETESVHRCSVEARRSIFEGGRRDALEREYAVLIEELNSHQCTLRARGSELSVALALSAIDDNVSSPSGESAAQTLDIPALPAAFDHVMRSQDLQKRGNSGSLTSGSESPILQPPGAEPKNGVRSRMAANLSNSGPRDEVEADNGAEMKILPPSRPKPARQKGQFAAANVSGTEQGQARITPTDSRAETVLAPTRVREDAAVGGSSCHAGATTSGSSGKGSAAMVRVASIGRSDTTGSGDRVLPLPDLSEQRQDVSTSLINAAVAAGCDEVSIAVVLSQSEHDQPDRQWTPDEFVRAVQENAKQQILKDRYSAASTTADRNAVAASGSTSYAGANPTLAEAASRLPVMPKTIAAIAGYGTAPLLVRPTTAATAAGYGGTMQPVPAARWDAGGSGSSNSGPLVGSGSALHGSRHATYPPVRSPTVGSRPLFFVEVAEKARLGDLPHNEKLSSSGSRLPLLAPSAFFVRGEQREMMQQPLQLHNFIPVVRASASAAVQPAPLPPQKRHVPSSALAPPPHQSQAALSESRSSPAVLSFAEGKTTGGSTEAISFAIEQGYNPAIVYEVAAQPGSTARIADFMQAVRARSTSAFAAGSAVPAAGTTAQVTKSRSAAPPSSKKGTDVLAFAKDYGYSEEEISAAMLDIGDNPTPQELLAALKKRLEAVRINAIPTASFSGSNTDVTQLAKRFGSSAQVIGAARQDRGENAAPRDIVAARRPSEASKAAPGPIAKALPVRSNSDVFAFAKDYGYSEEEISAARLDIGDNPTAQELLAALKKRSETSKGAVSSTATAAVLRPQSSADVDWPLPSRSRPADIGSRVAEPEPIGGGARGSPLKQGKGDGAAAAGSRKTAVSSAVGGSAGGRTQSTNTSATRDQKPTTSAQSSNKRRIVIDGSNVAMFKSDGIFRCRNIQICVNYFLKKGHTDITVVVPQHRRWDPATADAHILEDLQKKNLLVYQPSKKLPNMPSIRPYDDKLILDIAANYDGVVISNDNYKDLLNDTPKRDFIIRNRVIMFTIIGDDMFYINDDPMGMGGPTLEQLLTAT